MSYLDWIVTEKVRAAADFLCNGGTLGIVEAKDTLSALKEETKQHVIDRVGVSFYNAHYPTDRHGGPWRNGQPTGLVDHYTAGIDCARTLRWFSSRYRGEGVGNSSAHVVMDHDGTAMLIVDPKLLVAYHARSANPTHIGIEHVNAGKLEKNNNGDLLYQGRYLYDVNPNNPPEEADGYVWEPYTVAQVVTSIFLKRLFLLAIPTLERDKFIDHEVVDPARKSDCGPMWPMAAINKLAFSGEFIGKVDSLSGTYMSKDRVSRFIEEVHDLLS